MILTAIAHSIEKSFNFSHLPCDLKEYILAFMGPRSYNAQGVKEVVWQVVALMDKQSKSIFDAKIGELFIACSSFLIAKYSAHESSYQKLSDEWKEQNKNSSVPAQYWRSVDEIQRFLEKYDPARRPQLLDALSTGSQLPFSKCSLLAYTPEVEKDIKEIVRLMPESLHCRVGELRLRTEVPPLGMACMNPHIPIRIIEWLLKQGANPHETWSECNSFSGQVRIVRSLKYDKWCSELHPKRIKALLNLFAKYGAKPGYEIPPRNKQRIFQANRYLP